MERWRKYKSNRSTQDSSPKIRAPFVSIFDWQFGLSIDVASVRDLVLFVLQIKKIRCKKLSIYFVTEQMISEQHALHFGDPTVTDCITFPIDKRFLGEILICPEAALEYKHQDPYEEVTLYIIHSILHLIGFDDQNKIERALMKREEKKLFLMAKKKRCIVRSCC